MASGPTAGDRYSNSRGQDNNDPLIEMGWRAVRVNPLVTPHAEAGDRVEGIPLSDLVRVCEISCPLPCPYVPGLPSLSPYVTGGLRSSL